MKKYIAGILAAGTLWGFMGLFVRLLGERGIGSTGAVLLRCGLAAAWATRCTASLPGWP